MDLNKRASDFEQCCQKVFDTDEGKKLLQYLKETYVETKLLGQTADITFCNIGKADLVNDLIRISGVQNQITQTVKPEVDNDDSAECSAYDL